MAQASSSLNPVCVSPMSKSYQSCLPQTLALTPTQRQSPPTLVAMHGELDGPQQHCLVVQSPPSVPNLLPPPATCAGLCPHPLPQYELLRSASAARAAKNRGAYSIDVRCCCCSVAVTCFAKDWYARRSSVPRADCSVLFSGAGAGWRLHRVFERCVPALCCMCYCAALHYVCPFLPGSAFFFSAGVFACVSLTWVSSCQCGTNVELAPVWMISVCLC
jgi:hypothetical protein